MGLIKKSVMVYTDGGCHRDHNCAGGWGYFIKHPSGKKEEARGGEVQTTVARMELLAAIMALEALPEGTEVVVVTDSKYLQRGITEWIKNWLKNGWRNYEGQPVKNKDLWIRLLIAVEKHKVTFEWVRGHKGDPGNSRADLLATMGRRAAYDEWLADEAGKDQTSIGVA